MKYYTIQIPAETVGNLVYLGAIGIAIGSFYIIAHLLESFKRKKHWKN